MDDEIFNVGCKWSESMEYDVIKCKVAFFNYCNPFMKIMYSLMHGRNFRPTENEKNLVRLTEGTRT